MREEVIQKVYDKKIIAIARGLSQEHMLGLANALLAGGVEMMEVTFNQKDPDSFRDTADMIHLLNEKVGDRMLIGAGTVTTVALAELAYEAGARYIVSPNTRQDVIERTHELDMVSMPGALTPSEVFDAYTYGADFVKLFPISVLGSAYVKALRAPLSNIPLLAVGGINEKNLKEFYDAGVVGTGVGGNLVNKKWVMNGEFDKISQVARELVACGK